MAAQATQVTEIHEIKCKLICLSRAAVVPVVELLSFYAKSKSNKDEPNEAMADILKQTKKQLVNVKTLRHQDNKDKVYFPGTKNVLNVVVIKCLDLSLLIDLSKNIPLFPSCGKYRLQLMCKICLVSNDPNNLVCCIDCMLCARCIIPASNAPICISCGSQASNAPVCVKCNNPASNAPVCKTPAVRDSIESIHELRNTEAHTTDEECLLYEQATKSGSIPAVDWNQKIKDYSDTIKQFLQILVETQIMTEDGANAVTFKVDCILRTTKEVYWNLVTGSVTAGNLKPTVYEENLEVTIKLSSKRSCLEEVEDINSQTSKIISSTFEVRAERILEEQLNLMTNENKFKVKSKGMKYEPALQSDDSLRASIMLRISSTELKVPSCFQEMNSKESGKLRQDLAFAFHKIISKLVPEVKVICTGWMFKSINIYFAFIPNSEVERSQEQVLKDVKIICDIVLHAVEHSNQLLQKILGSHGLGNFNMTATFPETKVTESTTILQARVLIFDKMLTDQIRELLPVLKIRIENEYTDFDIPATTKSVELRTTEQNSTDVVAWSESSDNWESIDSIGKKYFSEIMRIGGSNMQRFQDMFNVSIKVDRTIKKLFMSGSDDARSKAKIYFTYFRHLKKLKKQHAGVVRKLLFAGLDSDDPLTMVLSQNCQMSHCEIAPSGMILDRNKTYDNVHNLKESIQEIFGIAKEQTKEYSKAFCDVLMHTGKMHYKVKPGCYKVEHITLNTRAIYECLGGSLDLKKIRHSSHKTIIRFDYDIFTPEPSTRLHYEVFVDITDNTFISPKTAGEDIQQFSEVRSGPGFFRIPSNQIGKIDIIDPTTNYTTRLVVQIKKTDSDVNELIKHHSEVLKNFFDNITIVKNVSGIEISKPELPCDYLLTYFRCSERKHFDSYFTSKETVYIKNAFIDNETNIDIFFGNKILNGLLQQKDWKVDEVVNNLEETFKLCGKVMFLVE